jgi:D-glycero-alpha-D-manno-heptose 1-phosphate guanylyltransferase
MSAQANTPGAMTTCIVLAGGLGTRLRSAVADLPKCLAPVGPRSFLDIQIDALLAAGVNDIVLSLGHLADKVVDALAGNPTHRPVRWVIEPELLGTGGAIAHVMDRLGLDEVLVANGDTFLTGDLRGMLMPLDRPRSELLRMATVHVSDRSRFGGVQINVQHQVERFLSKGAAGAGEINAGLYRLCRAALPAHAPGAYSLEADVMPDLVGQRAVHALHIEGCFTDIGVPQDYFQFCAEFGA